MIKNKPKQENKPESDFIQKARKLINPPLPKSITIERMRETQIDILKVLEKHGPLKRGQEGKVDPATLMAILGLSRTTIYDNLEKLEKKKLVERYSLLNGRRGKPIKLWRIIE
ncbi:MAG: hypothetical protein U9Q73_01870 [Nanoarchaeota archaeon]|nr:hypothetical protein [Nanoarchaeota archaeon]